MNENELSRLITDAALQVHQSMGGPGLDEAAYRNALTYELQKRGLTVAKRVIPPGNYPGVKMNRPTTLNMVVNDLVVVECKATPTYQAVYEAEALAHLRMAGLKLALVINFGEKSLKNGIRRVVSND
jgi:GxxExxY protein